MKAALACGVLAPAAFVGAWVAGGLALPDYDPVAQPISALAQEGAPTVALMTAGFVGFGLLLPVYAVALGKALSSRAVTLAATTSGLATLAVAALPLSREGGQPVDTWHAVAAGTGYVAQVLSPLVAAPALPGIARPLSYAVAVIAAAALVASLAVPDLTGLLQRTGLTVVDAWFAVTAVALRARR